MSIHKLNNRQFNNLLIIFSNVPTISEIITVTITEYCMNNEVI